MNTFITYELCQREQLRRCGCRGAGNCWVGIYSDEFVGDRL